METSCNTHFQYWLKGFQSEIMDQWVERQFHACLSKDEVGKTLFTLPCSSSGAQYLCEVLLSALKGRADWASRDQGFRNLSSNI